MSRIRTRTGNAPELVDTGSRPPADLLPAPLRALAAEYDSVTARYYAVERVINDLRATEGAQLEEAKSADAKANGLAARRGEPIATTNVDTLLKARSDADADLASLTDARRLVALDFYEVLSTEREGDTYNKAVSDARSKLTKAAASFQAAVAEAVRAKSVHEWVGGLPFDGSDAVLAEDLVPGLRIGNTNPPRSAVIIAALTQITD
jgi:hypothetical protein